MSRALLRRRFARVADWIEGAPPPAAVVWTAGPAPALVVDGVQLESRHAPVPEAELQARLVPAAAERGTVYGFAQGTLVRALLARAELRALRVVVLNPGLARAVLERCDAAWLADARVELVHPDACDELELPFAAPPAELRLAADAGARLRDLVVLELATPLIRAHQRDRARALAARAADTAARFRDDPAASALFGARPGATLCVAAAGPTLASHYDELRARAADLVAVDAALQPLLAAGVVPAFVVTQDPHEEGARRNFAVASRVLASTALVYFPEVTPDVIAAWPGVRFAARAELFSSGSVVHPAIDLAVRMGARSVELFGADFAMPGGRSHVADSAWQFEWELGAGTAWVLDGHGRRVPTLPNLIGYLRDLERYIARHPEVEFVTRSRAGAAIRGARCVEAVRVA